MTVLYWYLFISAIQIYLQIKDEGHDTDESVSPSLLISMMNGQNLESDFKIQKADI